MLRVYEPFVSANQKKYVNEAIDDNMLSYHGKYTRLFEKSIEDKFGIKHCIATTSGTTALFAAYTILKRMNGWANPVAITSTMTYAATASQLALAGYDIKFVEFADNLQIDIDLLEKALSCKHSPKTHLVVVPSVYGNMPDFKRVETLCKKYGAELIEDAAESFGCSQNGKFSGAFGVSGCYSFFANKVITCGEGGAITTNDGEFARLCRNFINQGVLVGFMHDTVGTNFRMTNLQAAIGYAQMEDYEEIIFKKQQIADYYRAHLSDKFKYITPSCKSTEWMPVFILPEGENYKCFAQYMNDRGIEVRPIFRPLNRMPAFSGISSTSYPCFRGGFEESHFILPSSPSLEHSQLRQIVLMANDFLSRK